MRKFLLLLAFMFVAISSSLAGNLQIVALVNEDVITSYDFYSRANMVLVNSGIAKNQENFQKLMPFVMQELIQESLQKQVAENIGLRVSDAEIKDAVLAIAERNNMELGDFYTHIKDSGVEINTIEKQIEAKILWQKYIGKKISPQVNISKDEVEEFMQKLSDNEGEQEYYVEELFYPVDSVETEENTQLLLEDLLSDIEEDPDSFTDYANSLSKAPNRGQIGWVLLESLPSEIKDFVSIMRKGDVSPVIRTIDGYSLIKVKDIRIIDNKSNQITKAHVEHKLTMEKVDILQRRKLRDLKDSAFIEIKVK